MSCRRLGRHLQFPSEGRHNPGVGVMHHAGLHDCLRPRRADRLRQPGQPVGPPDLPLPLRLDLGPPWPLSSRYRQSAAGSTIRSAGPSASSSRLPAAIAPSRLSHHRDPGRAATITAAVLRVALDQIHGRSPVHSKLSQVGLRVQRCPQNLQLRLGTAALNPARQPPQRPQQLPQPRAATQVKPSPLPDPSTRSPATTSDP
jgi:hypothetical protein